MHPLEHHARRKEPIRGPDPRLQHPGHFLEFAGAIEDDDRIIRQVGQQAGRVRDGADSPRGIAVRVTKSRVSMDRCELTSNRRTTRRHSRRTEPAPANSRREQTSRRCPRAAPHPPGTPPAPDARSPARRPIRATRRVCRPRSSAASSQQPVSRDWPSAPPALALVASAPDRSNEYSYRLASLVQPTTDPKPLRLDSPLATPSPGKVSQAGKSSHPVPAKNSCHRARGRPVQNVPSVQEQPWRCSVAFCGRHRGGRR